MKLTIIIGDGSVGKDGKFYNDLDLISCNIPLDVHALQWQGEDGWIEYDSPTVDNQNITQLPEWANCCLLKWEETDNKPIPEPVPPTAEENKQTASRLLYDTDWTTISDVSDPTKSDPYLENVNDFVVYRNAVRQYAVYPVDGNITWPTLPVAIWVRN
jgi:hypothetical protein